jgi:hypothetical protein
MTLFQNSADIAGDEKCLVDIKIIASPGLRELISQTTNTQTSIVVEDTFANSLEQKRIRDHLKRHDPPYFYSSKRGSWEQEKTVERRKFQDDHPIFGKNRKITSKELAAVCLAAFGEPESAKDKPRIVFEKVAGKDSPLYDRIFRVNNVAAQWLLPWELLRLATLLVREELNKAKEICPGDLDCDEAVRARAGAYGRFRMVHLAYGYLRKYAGENGDFISSKKSEDLLKSIGTWGRPLMQVSLDSVVDSFTDAQQEGQSSGLREFFRERKHQPLVLARFNRELARTERQAKRQRKQLPELLGLVG